MKTEIIAKEVADLCVPIIPYLPEDSNSSRVDRQIASGSRGAIKRVEGPLIQNSWRPTSKEVEYVWLAVKARYDGPQKHIVVFQHILVDLPLI